MHGRLPTVTWRTLNGPLIINVAFSFTRSGLLSSCFFSFFPLLWAPLDEWYITVPVTLLFLLILPVVFGNPPKFLDGLEWNLKEDFVTHVYLYG